MDLWYTKQFMKLITDAGFYNNDKERLLDVLSRKLYGLPGNIGITRLEGYAKCAYSQFLSYGLRLQEREKFSIQAYDIGNLYHPHHVPEVFRILPAGIFLHQRVALEYVSENINAFRNNHDNKLYSLFGTTSSPIRDTSRSKTLMIHSDIC